MEENLIKAAPSVNIIADAIHETTLNETATDPNSQFNPWNSDDLYQKAGSYDIYEKMLKDDQIQVAMSIKKDLIIGSGYYIVCDSDEDQEVRHDLEVALSEDCEAPFDDILAQLLSAYEYGFSISEKQFKLREDGSLTLKNIKTRNPVNWLLHQDIYGNVTRYEQQGTLDQKFTDIDPNSLIHFVNNPRFSNPYGTSDLRSAYQAYFIKTQIIRYYAIYLEKAASPIPHAKYDQMAKTEDVNKIYAALKKFQSSTAIVYPKEFEIGFLQSTGDGKVFLDGIAMMNMLIGRALFVPDLLGFQGGPTTGGSQALGREQMVIFFKHIHRRRRILEDLVNKHLIQPMVIWNWGFVEKYPKFKLKPIDEELAMKNAEMWLKAISTAGYKPTDEEINHFKKIIEFPETNQEDLEDESDEIEEIAAESQIESDSDSEMETESDSKDEMEIANDEQPEKFAAKVYDYPPGDYYKKTNFAAIEKQLDSDQDLFTSESSKVINEIFEAFFERISKLKNLTPNGLSRLENLSLKPALLNKLKKLMSKSFKTTFENSRQLAQQEIFKSNFALQPADEFLKTLEAEDLNFIGDWEYQITKAARIQIIAAIKDGKPISSVIGFIKDDTVKAALVSLDRYSRTKFTEVMNKGRAEFFKETKVISGYQFAAVLDDRTSDICNGLHGKKFVAGTEPVPPMHFNCRSVLVPITIYEEFEPDEKVGGQNIETFIEDNIGKGFAKQ